MTFILVFKSIVSISQPDIQYLFKLTEEAIIYSIRLAMLVPFHRLHRWLILFDVGAISSIPSALL
jgi:hypothetical protein